MRLQTREQAVGEVVGISRSKGYDGEPGQLARARNGMALGELERQEQALLKTIKAAEKALRTLRSITATISAATLA
jgi:hypothetical protein